MAEFQWVADVAAGVLKNHALSAKIRGAAIAKTIILPYIQPEAGYGRKAGESLTITRVRNVAEPTSAVVGERDRISVDTFAQSQVTVTVSGLGRAIEYSDQSELLSHYDIENWMQKKLREQMKLTLDTMAATALKTAMITFVPTSITGGTFETAGGDPVTVALSNVTVNHVKILRDYAADTIHIPGYGEDDRYILLLETKGCRGIRNDPEFLAWRAPQDAPSSFNKGKIGSIENVDIIEVNHTNALANNLGTGAVLGEGIFFGDDAAFMATARDPELLAAIPAEFGQHQAVAWYGILGMGIVWDTATDGEARIIRLTSHV